MTKRRESHIRDFALLFTGQTVSQLGTSMTSFALIIWVYTKNGQVMASSLLAICSAIPYLTVSLFGGAIVDNANKKKIMLICDSIAAICSFVILSCFMSGILELWILCMVNMVSGFMNAFQNPASQVAISLLVDPKDYARVGGVQSAAGSIVGILTPILAAGLLSIGDLGLIIVIDLGTFLFAFITLLLFVRIPDIVKEDRNAAFHEIIGSIKEAVSFLKADQGILILLLMYSVLEFMGAVSFDSMYSPLILARTDNSEMAVGIISAFMAAGCLAASIMLTIMKQSKRKLSMMYVGSFMCLAGITLFGMGRNMEEWCVTVLFGCFGSPIYSTYQTVILREKVPASMQGRIFSLQGMITGMLAPVGYLSGALLADHICEPLMQKNGKVQQFLSVFVGQGKGSGIGLIFVAAGLTGILFLVILSQNRKIKELNDIEI
ncbi:MFS transporter [Ruminococcus sp. 5_1_39BFAA]|uniref:MFS transporter n=1 Tax=Ruminococcus sp. 5_1_39BFAA TaxID=457412 RepID=UPI003564BB59